MKFTFGKIGRRLAARARAQAPSARAGRAALALCGALCLGACDDSLPRIEGQATQIVGSPEPATAGASVDESWPQYAVVSEQYFPPFAMLDGKGGVTGFEPDLLDEIGKEEKIRFRHFTHAWEGIFELLDAGKADVVSASVTVTPARMARYDFSDPYYVSNQTLLSTQGVVRQEDLGRLADFRVIVKRGTSSAEIVERIFAASGRGPTAQASGLAQDGKGADASGKAEGRKGGSIRYEDSTYMGARDVFGRSSDAVVSDSGPLRYYAKTYADYSPALYEMPGYPVEHIAFVFSKTRTDGLRDKINDGLAKLKDNGKLDELCRKWFGAPSAKLPRLNEIRFEGGSGK